MISSRAAARPPGEGNLFNPARGSSRPSSQDLKDRVAGAALSQGEKRRPLKAVSLNAPGGGDGEITMWVPSCWKRMATPDPDVIPFLRTTNLSREAVEHAIQKLRPKIGQFWIMWRNMRHQCYRASGFRASWSQRNRSGSDHFEKWMGTNDRVGPSRTA